MVVSNAGPLIWLSWAGQFDLLPILFGKVVIAPAVYAEVVERAAGYPNEANVRAACQAGWMEVVSVVDAGKVTLLLAELHVGEAETLVLAQEQNADAVLVDDLKARNLATLWDCASSGLWVCCASRTRRA